MMALILFDRLTNNNRHNLANGENNKDEENSNNSWKCGLGKYGVPSNHLCNTICFTMFYVLI